MDATFVRPKASTLLWTAVMTAPLLMPGARRRYGTIPVVIGVAGLLRQVYAWMRAPRPGPERDLRDAMHDRDVARAPHLRSHFD